MLTTNNNMRNFNGCGNKADWNFDIIALAKFLEKT